MMEKDFVKITGAVYKILDFLPEGEPLKNKAKEKVLEILESKLVSDIEILESYFEIAKNQGWISGVNYLIIIKQYEDIKSGIHVNPKPFTFAKATADKQLPMTLPAGQAGNQALNPKIPNLKTGKPAPVENYTKRQKKILEILGKNNKAQVSDLIKELPDVTKRTVRRDLDDLLKRDVIVRIGDFNQVFYEPKR